MRSIKRIWCLDASLTNPIEVRFKKGMKAYRRDWHGTLQRNSNWNSTEK